MLAIDSPLLQLPTSLNRKQAVFLDGVRHAAEIMALAHHRLRTTLTELVSEHVNGKAGHHLFTPAFLDAWVIVDAIDRLRSLLRNLPGLTFKAPPAGQTDFFVVTEVVRKIRNVADHIHSRVDHVVAKKGTALGTLSWYTVLDVEKHIGISCLLVPGTALDTMSELLNPAGRSLQLPTGLITLAAGEYKVCLSDVVTATVQAVEQLEKLLDTFFRENGIRDQYAATDMVYSAFMQFPQNTGQ